MNTNALLWSTEDHKLFKKIWIHESRHIIFNTDGKEETWKSWMGRGHWSMGHWHLLELQWTLNLKQTRHMVSNQYRVSTLHCWYNRGYSQSKNKHKPIAISEGTETHTCGRRVKLMDSLSLTNFIFSSTMWALVWWFCCQASGAD